MKSRDRHIPRPETRRGQTKIWCRCPWQSHWHNLPGDAQREYNQHVEQAERRGSKRKKHG